ncbi:required for respiratory growth 1, mitochondrial [Gossypium arboreum]|uniref:Required for respiratory growth 1, mitochondrial n=1 Tax=Gossypium arboreum TaxID=29729 RepID=A0A0B0NNI8_GOSAR|nr:required for respiratory growth 1, mitochondrial [Gossypium arboreum]
MALISYYKAEVPCKTMPRHGIDEFIRQGYHVRPCRDMAMASFKRIPRKPMTSHRNGKFFQANSVVVKYIEGLGTLSQGLFWYS